MLVLTFLLHINLLIFVIPSTDDDEQFLASIFCEKSCLVIKRNDINDTLYQNIFFITLDTLIVFNLFYFVPCVDSAILKN